MAWIRSSFFFFSLNVRPSASCLDKWEDRNLSAVLDVETITKKKKKKKKKKTKKPHTHTHTPKNSDYAAQTGRKKKDERKKSEGRQNRVEEWEGGKKRGEKQRR